MRQLLEKARRWFVEGWAEICQIFGGGAEETPMDLTEAAKRIEAATDLICCLKAEGLLGPNELVALRVSLAQGLARQAAKGDKLAMLALNHLGVMADRM